MDNIKWVVVKILKGLHSVLKLIIDWALLLVIILLGIMLITLVTVFEPRHKKKQRLIF